MKIISIGSCLSNLTASNLTTQYGWLQTHNIANVRSDIFLNCFIEHTQKQVPLSELEAFFRPKAEFSKVAAQILRAQYVPHFGFHDIRPATEYGATTFFEDLEQNEYDCIIIDNLIDVTSLLMHAKSPGADLSAGVFLNTHFYENEAEIINEFQFGDFLSQEQSISNWRKIISWLQKKQPKAKIFYLPFHHNTSVKVPERVKRIKGFYSRFKPWADSVGVRVVPPLNVDLNLTHGYDDWAHHKMEVYKALAGVIFLECQGQVPILGTNLDSSDSKLSNQTDLRESSERLAVANTNPYAGLPDYAFWRKSVGSLTISEVDPVINPKFTIGVSDQIITAGSCFAQHISRTLVREGYNYLITEPSPKSEGAIDENFGLFPARFGNIYTIRQLLQLFNRAFGADSDAHIWQRDDGRWIDAFRPRVQTAGYSSRLLCYEDRIAHLKQVREMFSTSDVLVFTLGLTEGWRGCADDAIIPFPPGAASARSDGAYEFINFSAAECTRDLNDLVDCVIGLNPRLKILLTVSPVPLIATYERRHVLTSTTYSKAALRVAAENVVKERAMVDYFPSFEIISGAYAKSSFFESDLREVTPEGVARVMSLFKLHYLGKDSANVTTTFKATTEAAPPSVSQGDATMVAYLKDLHNVICDEESLDVLYKRK